MIDPQSHRVEIGNINNLWSMSCSCGRLTWHDAHEDAVTSGVDHLAVIDCMANHPSNQTKKDSGTPVYKKPSYLI
jgi:hypothetical protein